MFGAEHLELPGWLCVKPQAMAAGASINEATLDTRGIIPDVLCRAHM